VQPSTDCRRVAGRLEIASDRLLNRRGDVEILGGGVSSPRAATPALAENTRVTQANAPWVMNKQLAHARCLEADGVVLFSNANSVYLGDKRFEPAFEELERPSAVRSSDRFAGSGGAPVGIAEFAHRLHRRYHACDGADALLEPARPDAERQSTSSPTPAA
jgi:hypothetical protein